jgi:hypothetical protein
MSRLFPLALAAIFAAAPVFAQGNGNAFGRSKGRGAKPPATSGGDQVPAIPGTGIRNFGIWLDDASLLPQGHGWTTFGVSYWRSIYGHQWDVPSVDAGVAIHRRVQVGLSAPLSYASYNDGYTSRGLGDMYLSTKIGLIDPDEQGRRFGVAVVPVLEVLSSSSVLEGESRLHWAIPVTVERRFDGFRIYGAGGYFSRGAVFGAGAVEVPLTDRIVASGMLSHSRSLEDDALSDALQLTNSRFDLTGGLAYVVTPSVIAYGSVGRTISRADANASSLAVSGGLSFGFEGR